MSLQTEYWLSGLVNGVPELLQPVAHALLQARAELQHAVSGFKEELLWQQPAGNASVAFHLQHIPGVLDRLFTYARGGQLNESQLKYLASEGKEDKSLTVSSLMEVLSQKVNESIEYLKTVDPETLTHARGVGRKQIPSTVMGLLFHSAEHTMRHTGQLLVTVRILSPKTDN